MASDRRPARLVSGKLEPLRLVDSAGTGSDRLESVAY